MRQNFDKLIILTHPYQMHIFYRLKCSHCIKVTLTFPKLLTKMHRLRIHL